MTRLEEIKARLSSITQGQWEQAGKSVRVTGSQIDVGPYKAAPTGYCGAICNCLGGGYGAKKNDPVEQQARENANFIAHAPDDIQYLLDLLEHYEN